MILKSYTKNPVRVEAVQVEKIWFPNIALWCNGLVAEYVDREGNLVECVEVNTNEGIVTARVGDYIVKWSEIDFTVCPEEYFKYTYTECE